MKEMKGNNSKGSVLAFMLCIILLLVDGEKPR
jgi:hypothetical protein